MLTNSFLKKKKAEDCKNPKLILEARHSLSIEIQKMKKERLSTRLFIPENKASASASAEKRRYIGKLENILRRTKAKVSLRAPNIKGREEKREQLGSNEKTTTGETQLFKIKKTNKSDLQTHQVKLQESTRTSDIDSDDKLNKSKTNYAHRDNSPFPYSSFEMSECRSDSRPSLQTHTHTSAINTEAMTEDMTQQINSYKFDDSDIAKNNNHSYNVINSTHEHAKHIARYYRDGNARQDTDVKSIGEHRMNVISANRSDSLVTRPHNPNRHEYSHDNRNEAVFMKMYENNDSSYLLHNPYNLKHESLSQSNGNYLPAINREMNVNNRTIINNNFPIEEKLINFENMKRRRIGSLKRENRVRFPQFHANSQLYCNPRNFNIMKIENEDPNDVDNDNDDDDDDDDDDDKKLKTQYNSVWPHNILIEREKLEETISLRDQRNWENEMQISRRIASQLPYGARSVNSIQSNDINKHYFFGNTIEDPRNMVCTRDNNINAYRTNYQMYGSAIGIQNFYYNNASTSTMNHGNQGYITSLPISNRSFNETSELIPYVEHDLERQAYIEQGQYLPMMHLLSNEIMRTTATADIFPRHHLGHNEHSISTELFLPSIGQPLPHKLTSKDFTAPGANHVFSPL
ncbi:uncharacterized protein ACN427_005653 [Glossina fuscipes fuscipes]